MFAVRKKKKEEEEEGEREKLLPRLLQYLLQEVRFMGVA